MVKKKSTGQQPDKIAEIEAYGRVEVRLRALDWVGRVAIGLVVALCFRMAEPVVGDLAGKETSIDFVAQLGWGAAAAREGRYAPVVELRR